MKFKHFLLTKFNVQLGKDGRAYTSGSWLDHRLALFEKYCYPSVQAQACKNFEWLVFFHPDTAEKYVERINSLDGLVPIYCAFKKEEIKKAVQSRLGEAEYIITSRLDNDDAIARRYIGSVQGCFSEREEREFINFTNGCQLHSDCAHTYGHEANPFISLIEKAKGFHTVWCKPHGQLHTVGEIRQVETPHPMWMIVIHEHNLSNRIAAWADKRLPDLDLNITFGVA